MYYYLCRLSWYNFFYQGQSYEITDDVDYGHCSGAGSTNSERQDAAKIIGIDYENTGRSRV